MLDVLKNGRFFSIFSCYELSPYVFGQAKSIAHILFDDQDWQGKVPQIMKNDHFLVFLGVLVLFLKFLGSIMSGLC